MSVIPNAVNGDKFTPEPSARPRDRIVVVCMSRLVYRKGVDLLAQVIPKVCAARNDIDFLVGGDGPKRDVLHDMLAAHAHVLTPGRVTLLGDVDHDGGVRSVLTRGHIFLSASLTESFGIAILEAACCGMLVVATAVGGIPEVLPHTIMRLAPPDADALASACVAAAAECAARRRNARGASEAEVRHAWEQHEAVKAMYCWADVAARVEAVYDKAAATSATALGRLRRYAATGQFSGLLFAAVAVWDALLMRLLEWLVPADSIDICPDLR